MLKNWIVLERAPDRFLNLLPEHPLLLQALYNRGMRTAEEMSAFLANDDAVVENPFRLKDMTTAVERIIRAIESGERLCVYGDFDADGVCATAVLVSALQAVGAQVGAYIPNRVDEGYGLNADAIALIAEKADILITVDCGIRSRRRNRIRPVAGPGRHRDRPPYDWGDAAACAGCGEPATVRMNWVDLHGWRAPGWRIDWRRPCCAWHRIMRGVRWRKTTVEEVEASLLDLVAIGTVADMMPLLSENRSLVRRGLTQLNMTQRPGLQELFALAGVRPGGIDASAVSFRIGPRINAAGRMASAQLAYRLVRTQDSVEGYALAKELETLNTRRRSMTEGAERVAEEQVLEDLAQGRPLLTVSSPEIPSGVVGLVAGKLTDRYYRPAIVVEEGEEFSRGSARSIDEFDISRALDEVSDMLVRHGGHGRAAGFTVETERLAEVIDALQEIASRDLQNLGDLRPTLEIDAETLLEDVDWALLEQFGRLEPTGQENRQPKLLSRGARVRDSRTVGGDKHLKLIVDSGPNTPVLDAIAFSQGRLAQSDGGRRDRRPGV